MENEDNVVMAADSAAEGELLNEEVFLSNFSNLIVFGSDKQGIEVEPICNISPIEQQPDNLQFNEQFLSKNEQQIFD